MERGDIALIFSGIMCAFLVFEKLFGGGSKLANKFHDLSTNTTNQVSLLRTEVFSKVESIDSMYRVGLDAIVANQHRAEIGFLELRAKLAEEYMRAENFHKAADELKRDFKDANREIKEDMKDGFEEVKRQLSEMAQAIEAARKSTNQSHRRSTNA